MNRTLLQIFLVFVLVAAPARAAESVSLYPIQTIAGGPGGGGDVGQYSRLAHDPAGGQHVAYYDATYGDLKYAHRAGNGEPWTVEIVDSKDDIGRWCAIAVGAASETTGTANVINGSRTVEITTGTMPTSVIAGGQFRLEPGGTWQTIASVDPERHRIELVAPYSGPSASDAPFRVRYYQPTISYQGRASFGSTLRIARPGDAGAWKIADVDPPTTPTQPSHMGFETGVAIDSASRIHVVYQDRATTEAITGQLRYAMFDGTNWTFDNPVRSESVTGADRICIDSTDHIWLFCRDSTTNQLLALTPTTGSWVRTILDNSGRAGLGIDAMFDPVEDTIFVSNQNRESTDTAAIKLSRGSANGSGVREWGIETVGTALGTDGDYTSIAHGNAAGTQQLLYYDSLVKHLLLLRPTMPGALEYGDPLIVDAGADVGRYCSAGVNPVDDALYASYYDSRATALKMARNNWTSESTTTYVDGIKAGVYSDIGFTATEVIAAYYNATECNLHVARWPRGGIPADGTDVVVDASSSNVGEYVSMAIDAKDRIFIAYYDRTNTKLRMAIWDLSEWLTNDVGNLGAQNYGEFCKVAIDPTGTRIALACRDSEHLSITAGIGVIPDDFGTSRTIGFDSLVMTAGEEVGRYLSMTWGNSGELHMAYFNDKTFSPMYSVVGTTVTATETIEHSNYNIAGWFTSIAMGPTGQPAVVYQDVTHGSLKHAERTGDNQWTITTLADKGVTGFYPILKFDPVSNEQYVVYYDQSGGKLMLRSKPLNGTAWRDPLTLASGTRGIRPAVAIDSDGRFYMSFYYQLGGDLLYMNPASPPNFNATQNWNGYR